MSDFQPAALFLGLSAASALCVVAAYKLGYTYLSGLVYRHSDPKRFSFAVAMQMGGSLVFFLIGLGALIGALRLK